MEPTARWLECVRGSRRVIRRNASHRLSRHLIRNHRHQLMAAKAAAPVIRRERGHFAARYLMTKQCVTKRKSARGFPLRIHIRTNANHRRRSRLRFQRHYRPTTPRDAAREQLTIFIHGHSAPNSITAMTAKLHRFANGMAANMQSASHRLNRRRRPSHQHLLILERDAVMAMVFMPRSASVWMKRDRAAEHRIASGWRRMTRRNVSRRPHRRLPHLFMRRAAVLDIRRAHSRFAMELITEQSVNRLECAHGSCPRIRRNASHRLNRHIRRCRPLLLSDQDAVPETRRERGHSV